MNTQNRKGGLWDWATDHGEICCRSYVTSVGWMLELHFNYVRSTWLLFIYFFNNKYMILDAELRMIFVIRTLFSALVVWSQLIWWSVAILSFHLTVMSCPCLFLLIFFCFLLSSPFCLVSLSLSRNCVVKRSESIGVPPGSGIGNVSLWPVSFLAHFVFAWH